MKCGHVRETDVPLGSCAVALFSGVLAYADLRQSVVLRDMK